MHGSLSRSNNSSPRLRLKNWCCHTSSTFIISLWRRGQNRIGLSVNELLDHFCSFHQWTCQYFKQLWLVFVNVTKPCPGARHNAFFFFGDDSWWWHVLYARLPAIIAFCSPPPLEEWRPSEEARLPFSQVASRLPEQQKSHTTLILFTDSNIWRI